MEIAKPSIARVFGERLRHLRQVAGLSQEVVAELVGISQTYLSALERGLKFPTAEIIERFARVYGVEYSELFVDVVSSVTRNITADDEFVTELERAVGRFARDWIAEHRS